MFTLLLNVMIGRPSIRLGGGRYIPTYIYLLRPDEKREQVANASVVLRQWGGGGGEEEEGGLLQDNIVLSTGLIIM